LKEQSQTKSPVKPTWSKKMTVLTKFLEFPLNVLYNNVKNTSEFSTVRQKSGIKV